MKNLKNCTTYTINEKGYPGGINTHEYTWEEVLEFYEAPEDIKTIDELVSYCEDIDGHAFGDIIEKFLQYDENGIFHDVE